MKECIRLQSIFHHGVTEDAELHREFFYWCVASSRRGTQKCADVHYGKERTGARAQPYSTDLRVFIEIFR